jgi:hypothetical protein
MKHKRGIAPVGGGKGGGQSASGKTSNRSLVGSPKGGATSAGAKAGSKSIGGRN